MIPAGLGTSSILGGCILAGLFRVSGNLCDMDSLVHAVSWLYGIHLNGIELE